MSDDEPPWTIKRVCDTLGTESLAQRVRAEIEETPLENLPDVLLKWQRIARNTLAAVERGRLLAEYDARGEEPPGVWIDGTARLEGIRAKLTREQTA